MGSRKDPNPSKALGSRACSAQGRKFCFLVDNTVRGRKIGQFSFFKSHILFHTSGVGAGSGPWEFTCFPLPAWPGPHFVAQLVALLPVSLHVIKNLTKVNSDPLYQVHAAFYFLLLYLNFQRIENSSCHFLPCSLLKYLILGQFNTALPKD